jgi:site-specific DNA-methyltransferase (adenine-specific)
MLRTEADVVRALGDGTYTLDELYALCEAQADVDRDGGRDAIHPGDERWRRRVRGVLMNLKASGRCERVGRSAWAIRDTREQPQRMLLIVAGGTLREFELRLQTAVELLGSLDEPADLVLTDPPYGLHRGTSRSSAGRVYERDASRVVGGYQDVDPAEYEHFTFGWVEAAAAALRRGGQLVCVTGPQRASVVQYAAEQSGLTWVSSIAAYKAFPLRMTRRPACSHWVATVMVRGRIEDPKRVFNCPPDLPKARSGVDYPLDLWLDNGRADRPGDALKYDNALPPKLVSRLLRAFSNESDLTVDPFLGGGETAAQAWRHGRRFVGGDVNPSALRFTAARMLDEHLWPAETQPALFDAALAA